MLISLSPIRMDAELNVTVQGDVMTINGLELDFSVIPDGATLPAEAVECEFVIGEISRVDGVLQITLLFPIGPDASEAARFPVPFTPEDGVVEFPQ